MIVEPVWNLVAPHQLSNDFTRDFPCFLGSDISSFFKLGYAIFRIMLVLLDFKLMGVRKKTTDRLWTVSSGFFAPA
ncbi:MAG: hypothetical protein K8S87_00800, partial [Planctomycetes bacterium]|nr:hypothetical protein [Planctomycetota bacterium]